MVARCKGMPTGQFWLVELMESAPTGSAGLEAAA
jgi:hypothetical protein